MLLLQLFISVFGVLFQATLIAATDTFPCLTDGQVSSIIANQIIEITQPPGYVEVVKKLHTKDFIGISDSVNFVTGSPLNTTTTHSRKELLDQLKELPPAGEVKTLFTSYTCDTITWYFELAATPLPVRGITIFFVDEKHKVYKRYREVNSGALLYDGGQPKCESTFAAGVGSDGPESTEAACGKPCYMV